MNNLSAVELMNIASSQEGAQGLLDLMKSYENIANEMAESIETLKASVSVRDELIEDLRWKIDENQGEIDDLDMYRELADKYIKVLEG